MEIKEITNRIMEWCERKGWNKDVSGGELQPAKMMMNLHAEVSEAWEELRDGKDLREYYFAVRKNDKEAGYLSFISGLDQLPITMKLAADGNKPEGFPIELADLAIRLFHICGHLGIDLEDMIKVKMVYNETRPYRHGGKKA